MKYLEINEQEIEAIYKVFMRLDDNLEKDEWDIFYKIEEVMESK